MSVFYQSLDKKTALAFKKRKKDFKKGKSCSVCGKKYPMYEMMVAHIKPVTELTDAEALYDTTNWVVKCIYCEQKYNKNQSNKTFTTK